MKMYNNILYEITENSCTIYNGFTIKNRKIMTEFCKYVLSSGVFSKRSSSSYVREWCAHNLMYRFKISPKRTRDVDLDARESAFRRFVYFVLSILYF